MVLHRSIFTIGLTLLTALSQQVTGQGTGGGMGGKKGRIEGKVKFMPLPYLNYDRSMGFMFGGLPMLMFNPVEKDTVSPSSLIGGLGMYSTSKTWFAMGFGMFHFNRDNWRVTTFAGTGKVHFQFFLDNLISSWVPYQSDATFAMVRLERRIYEKIYGGISYVYADIVTELENLPVADSLKLNGIGLNLSMDRRENPYYPRNGCYSNIVYHTFPEWMGNELVSHKIELDHNHYFPLRQNLDVVAARLFVGLGLGELGFSQQFIVGGRDIRGYTQGEFRGNYLLSLQGEYRWNFLPRWGAVGFAGLATVFKAINESDSGRILPGAGAGLRFKAFKETNLSVGIDIAKGIGDWGLYFQIGEAF